MADIYDLGQKLAKERTELGALLADPAAMTAEQVAEAKKREDALADMQRAFDTALEADRLAKGNADRLAAITAEGQEAGTIRVDVEPRPTAPRAPVTPSMSVQSANQPSARRTRVLAEPTSAVWDISEYPLPPTANAVAFTARGRALTPQSISGLYLSNT